MVTRRKEHEVTNSSGKGKLKFRYWDSERALDFSVENITGDINDGLRSIANAVAGRTIVGAGRAKPKPALATSAVDVEDEVETETPAQEVLEPEEEESEASGEQGNGSGSSRPRVVRKPKAPKLLSTPKLTDAKVPLADFLKQKNPQDMMDKYAVIAVWYKEQFQIEDIDIDRIFTAFKHLGIESQLPTDVSKPLKNLAYNRKWFDKSKTKANTYTLNWVGESEVGKMGTGAAKP